MALQVPFYNLQHSVSGHTCTSSFKKAFERSDLTINLFGNRLPCTCDNQEFLISFQEHNSQFLRNKEDHPPCFLLTILGHLYSENSGSYKNPNRKFIFQNTKYTILNRIVKKKLHINRDS